MVYNEHVKLCLTIYSRFDERRVLDNVHTRDGGSRWPPRSCFRLIAFMAHRHRHSNYMYLFQSLLVSYVLVAEAIALRLKENAISAGATRNDIYRPTIGFAGAMILGGGCILCVCLRLFFPFLLSCWLSVLFLPSRDGEELTIM
jgi:hypothetical protein